MVPDALTVIVPIVPSPKLSPNARVHYMTRAKEAAKMREAFSRCTLDTLNAVTWEHDGAIGLGFHVFWQKRARTKDWDNVIASMKPAVDGIFDNLQADDRQVVSITVKQDKDPDGVGYTVVRVIAIDNVKEAA